MPSVPYRENMSKLYGVRIVFCTVQKEQIETVLYEICFLHRTERAERNRTVQDLFFIPYINGRRKLYGVGTG